LEYHRFKITGVTFQNTAIFACQLVQKFKSGYPDSTGSKYIEVHEKANVQHALAYSRILVKAVITKKLGFTLNDARKTMMLVSDGRKLKLCKSDGLECLIKNRLLVRELKVKHIHTKKHNDTKRTALLTKEEEYLKRIPNKV
jgi:hypothetical protein